MLHTDHNLTVHLEKTLDILKAVRNDGRIDFVEIGIITGSIIDGVNHYLQQGIKGVRWDDIERVALKFFDDWVAPLDMPIRDDVEKAVEAYARQAISLGIMGLKSLYGELEDEKPEPTPEPEPMPAPSVLEADEDQTLSDASEITVSDKDLPEVENTEDGYDL